MNNDNGSLRAALAAPFADAEIEWRLQWTDKEKGTGIAVPYVDNRAIQNRLDECVGINGWKNAFFPWHESDKKASQICGLSIWFADIGEWVTKYDGAEDSDIERIKGGLSDAMKRAAVQWGIGRYLYGMDAVFVDTETRGRTPAIKKTERVKLDKAHREHAAKVSGTAPAAKGAPKKTAQTETDRTPPVPENDYTVVSASLQASAKGGNNTVLQLKTGDGDVIKAFARGENPAFVPGAVLTGAKISERVSGGVKFMILEGFVLREKAA
jgi:hypothetical protein